MLHFDGEYFLVLQDWSYLLQSDHHEMIMNNQNSVLGLNGDKLTTSNASLSNEKGMIDPSSPLFSHLPTVLFALHLVYEVRSILVFPSALKFKNCILYSYGAQSILFHPFFNY